MAIYTGNVAHKNRRERGEKEHPVELPRDVQYYWRMVRDLNPRRSYFIPCPISSRMHSTALPTILEHWRFSFTPRDSNAFFFKTQL